MNLRDFRHAGHAPTLLSAFLYFDVSFMVWLLPGALANSIVPDFGLSDAQKGLMVAVPLLGGAVLRLALGLLTDRIGARRTGILGMSLDDDPPVAGLALGRFVQQDAAGRAAAGRLGGEFRRGLAAGEPLVPAAVSGAGDGDRGSGQQRHGPGHVLRPEARTGLGLARGVRPGADPAAGDTRLLPRSSPRTAPTSRRPGRSRPMPTCSSWATPGGSACSTRSRSAGSSAWRAFSTCSS